MQGQCGSSRECGCGEGSAEVRNEVRCDGCAGAIGRVVRVYIIYMRAGDAIKVDDYSAPGARLAVTVGHGQSQTVAVGAAQRQTVAVSGCMKTRPSRPTRARPCHGPTRACHAAPLHTCHPWGVGSLRLARLAMQRACSGDVVAKHVASMPVYHPRTFNPHCNEACDS